MLNGEEVNDYDVYFRTKEACVKIAIYYADLFNRTHNTKVTVTDENDRVQCFIKSAGVATDGEESGITDETEPYVESPTINNEKPKYRPVFFSTNAIFNAAIKQIEKMKEKDSNLSIDNTYLFEVINRIF